MMKHFLLRMVGKVVKRPVLRHLVAFEEATQTPRKVQENLLHRILRRQTDTDFGHRHGFDAIRTVQDFRKQLPVASYEYFEPYINRLKSGEVRALLADDQVVMFALTSG